MKYILAIALTLSGVAPLALSSGSGATTPTVVVDEHTCADSDNPCVSCLEEQYEAELEAIEETLEEEAEATEERYEAFLDEREHLHEMSRESVEVQREARLEQLEQLCEELEERYERQAEALEREFEAYGDSFEVRADGLEERLEDGDREAAVALESLEREFLRAEAQFERRHDQAGQSLERERAQFENQLVAQERQLERVVAQEERRHEHEIAQWERDIEHHMADAERMAEQRRATLERHFEREYEHAAQAHERAREECARSARSECETASDRERGARLARAARPAPSARPAQPARPARVSWATSSGCAATAGDCDEGACSSRSCEDRCKKARHRGGAVSSTNGNTRWFTRNGSNDSAPRFFSNSTSTSPSGCCDDDSQDDVSFFSTDPSQSGSWAVGALPASSGGYAFHINSGGADVRVIGPDGGSGDISFDELRTLGPGVYTIESDGSTVRLETRAGGSFSVECGNSQESKSKCKSKSKDKRKPSKSGKLNRISTRVLTTDGEGLTFRIDGNDRGAITIISPDGGTGAITIDDLTGCDPDAYFVQTKGGAATLVPVQSSGTWVQSSDEDGHVIFAAPKGLDSAFFENLAEELGDLCEDFEFDFADLAELEGFEIDLADLAELEGLDFDFADLAGLEGLEIDLADLAGLAGIEHLTLDLEDLADLHEHADAVDDDGRHGAHIRVIRDDDELEELSGLLREMRGEMRELREAVRALRNEVRSLDSIR